jgi:hypothetical protein
MIAPHDYFGIMQLDERRRSCRAAVNFSPNHKVSVTIDWTGIPPAEALKRSQDICERIRVRESETRSKITHELLRLYNETWSAGRALDADNFMRRISLAEIQVSPADFGSPCCATLYYADGDLFAGHSIEVFLDADLNYAKSQLAG